MFVSQVDPWLQTIRLLSSGSRRPDAGADKRLAAKRGTSYGCEATSSTSQSPHLKVSLLERSTSSTVTISWRDPTSCSYGAQIWRVASAKVSGICALSG